MRKVIFTVDAPAPIGPYQQAVLAHNTLYVSGQIAINPHSGELILDNINNECHQVLKNISAILLAANMDFSHIVKASIFLSNMDYFSDVNKIYESYFKDNFPARETVAVKTLPKNVNVEIAVIAVADD